MTFAAWMNRVLRYLLPRLVMRPRIDRPPVLYWRETRPSHAPKSRPAFLQRLSMGHALIIALLFGSTLLAQAEPFDRDKWVRQTGRANRTCLAKSRGKLGSGKDHAYATRMADQTNKEIDACTGIVSFPVVSASDR